MNQRIKVIYQNGVFRPLQPLDLPEGSIVWLRITESLGDDANSLKDADKNLFDPKESERKRLEKEIGN